jgi:predicted nucleic acid-binding protein
LSVKTVENGCPKMLLDTFIWIEILINSPKGRLAVEKLGKNKPSTATPSIAELVVWSLKNGIDPDAVLEKIFAESNVLHFPPEVAELSGRLHFRYRQEGAAWGLVDAMIYATALANGEELLTGDRDFERIPGCTVI